MGNWEMVSYIGMMRNSSQDIGKREPSGTRRTQYKASKILRVKKRKKRTFFVGVSETVCHQSALALLTRMSTLPNLVTVFVTHSMHACSERRSRMTGKAVAPVFNAAISSATVYMVPGSVGCTVADFAATTTLHPCFANARHTALPIPRLPPVTIATLPLNEGNAGGAMKVPATKRGTERRGVSRCDERTSCFRLLQFRESIRKRSEHILYTIRTIP